MPQIIKKTDSPETPAFWEPFQMLRTLLRTDPILRMVPLALEKRETFMPSFEVRDTKDGLLFKADLPGVKEADLEISLSGHLLTIKGKREEEEKEQSETYFAYERSYGSFSRSFSLPEEADTDEIKADLKDGVLTLVVSKQRKKNV